MNSRQLIFRLVVFLGVVFLLINIIVHPINYNKVSRTAMRSIGIVKVQVIETNAKEIQLPVSLQNPISVYVISKESFLGKILKSRLLQASAITINPIGIFAVGELSPQTKKEEIYHWWEASKMGPLAYYSSYMLELGHRVVECFNIDRAYDSLSFEKNAKAYSKNPAISSYLTPSLQP